MKAYYIQHDNDRQGPFSAEQLIEMKIQPATKIWVASLKTVLDASDIPELRRKLFPLSTAYVATRHKTVNKEENVATNKTSGLKEKIKIALAIVALVIAGFLVIKLRQGENQIASVTEPAASTSVVASKAPASPKKTKAKEAPIASKLIKANVNWRKNLVGEIVLSGDLVNSSNTAGFKDPVVLITWLNKSNVVVGTERKTINESLPAGKTSSFKIKLKAPGKIGDVQVSIESATVTP